ncbi:MAG: serine/threonine protein kinase, partial [Kangiellaceae bacterium]|nr:serine/threonine protein kinase [Kangiellaceae bacterium]
MNDDSFDSVRQAIQKEQPTIVSDTHSGKEQPRMLGRYRILDEVGRGATALVYRAYDPQLDRFLAIKLLRQRLAKDDAYREGFIREARLAAQLTHSNIVTIYDVGISDDKPYIAMELLEGSTLEEVLKRTQKLNLNSAISITSQLASALAYAHNRGV